MINFPKINNANFQKLIQIINHIAWNESNIIRMKTMERNDPRIEGIDEALRV